MSPRPGGEADKFSVRYEGAWTVWRLLDILTGDGASLTVEVAGEIDDGAECLYSPASDGVVEAHQVKRQQGTANAWRVQVTTRSGYLGKCASTQNTAKDGEFHFASTTPAPKLNELADRARRSQSSWYADLRSPLDDAQSLCVLSYTGAPAGHNVRTYVTMVTLDSPRAGNGFIS